MLEPTLTQTALPTTWVQSPNKLIQTPNQNILDWLTKPYILSHALRKIASSLKLTLISQQTDFVLPEERLCLNLCEQDQHSALVRKIFLHSEHEHYIFARTIVPPKTYQALQAEIESVGDNFIGEYLLYNKAEVQRDAFEYAYMTKEMAMMQELQALMPESVFKAGLWARRSCFWIKRFPILITELFLSDLPRFPC